MKWKRGEEGVKWERGGRSEVGEGGEGVKWERGGRSEVGEGGKE